MCSIHPCIRKNKAGAAAVHVCAQVQQERLTERSPCQVFMHDRPPQDAQDPFGLSP